MFGPLEVAVNGVPLPRLRSRTGYRLLALLVLRHDREVEREWLAGTLWPESTAAQGAANLRETLKDLRHALGPEALRLGSPGRRTLRLDLAGADVDLTAFDALTARGDPASLEAALSLYRAPLLEGWTEEWAFRERQVREEEYLRALERLAAGAQARGNLAGAEEQLRRAVAVDPLRETAQRALMQVLAARGNDAAAIRVYRDLRLRLHREINAQPDTETQALFRQLRAEARKKADGGTERRGDGGTASTQPPLSPVAPSPPLPVSLSLSDTVTFLFADIAGSTRLWEQYPDTMPSVLARQNALLRQIIEAHDGTLFKTVGDQCCAAFPTAPDALHAALAAQQAVSGVQAFRRSGGVRIS